MPDVTPLPGDHEFSASLNTAIQRAASPAYQSHKKWPIVSERVVIPAGVYHAHAPIQLRNGVEIVGESQSSVIIISHLHDDEKLFYSDPGDELYAVKIRQMHIRAGKKYHGQAIDLVNANRNCLVEDVFIENFKLGVGFFDSFTTCFRDSNIYMCETGMVASNMTNGRIRDIKVENCAKHGIELANRDKRTTTGLLLHGVVAQGNGRAGLYINGIDQARIVSLFVEGNNRAMTRRPGDTEDFAQVVMRSDRNKLNRRNGNVVFESIFLTPGHSEMEKTTAIKIENAENVVFSGGTIRNFSGKIETVFDVSPDVTSATFEHLTLERVKDQDFIKWSAPTVVSARNNYASNGETAPYRRLPEL